MFEGYAFLTGIENLSIIKTDNVTDMSHMFEGCTNLKQIDLSILKLQKSRI